MTATPPRLQQLAGWAVESTSPAQESSGGGRWRAAAAVRGGLLASLEVNALLANAVAHAGVESDRTASQHAARLAQEAVPLLARPA